MADSLYLSLWFADFSLESMFARALSIMREFPVSQSRPGVTALAVHPVAWGEPTILEQRFNPGAQAEEAISAMAGLSHEDYSGWHWTPGSDFRVSVHRRRGRPVQ